jgi:hypothetical protein
MGTGRKVKEEWEKERDYVWKEEQKKTASGRN